MPIISGRTCITLLCMSRNISCSSRVVWIEIDIMVLLVWIHPILMCLLVTKVNLTMCIQCAFLIKCSLKITMCLLATKVFLKSLQCVYKLHERPLECLSLTVHLCHQTSPCLSTKRAIKTRYILLLILCFLIATEVTKLS